MCCVVCACTVCAVCAYGVHMNNYVCAEGVCVCVCVRACVRARARARAQVVTVKMSVFWHALKKHAQ